MSVRSAVLSLALTYGCGMTPPTAPKDAGPSCEPFVPGTVDANGDFVPLTENLDVTIFNGAQGGYHLFVAAKVNGPKTGTLEWTLRTASGTELAWRALDVAAIKLVDTDCGWMRQKDLLVFERNEDVPGARGMPATLTAKLESLEKTVTIVPR